MTHFAVAPADMFMLLATKFTQKNETLNFRSNRGSCDTKVYICLSIHLTAEKWLQSRQMACKFIYR